MDESLRKARLSTESAEGAVSRSEIGNNSISLHPDLIARMDMLRRVQKAGEQISLRPTEDAKRSTEQ
jgi:hypothetical protein